jgi:hypothetical protein
MLQFSEVGETEALPAMSPFAMRNENLVVNRSTVRGNPVVEPAVPSRTPTPQPVVPTVAPVAPMPPTVAHLPPLPPPVAPPVAAKPELPSMVYLLLGLNAITIALCLTLILARR